jgi:hypothetical protein
MIPAREGVRQGEMQGAGGICTDVSTQSGNGLQTAGTQDEQGQVPAFCRAPRIARTRPWLCNIDVF